MRFVCLSICVCNEKQCTHLGVCQINSAVQADLDLLNCKIGLRKSWKMFHISRSNTNFQNFHGQSFRRSFRKSCQKFWKKQLLSKTFTVRASESPVKNSEKGGWNFWNAIRKSEAEDRCRTIQSGVSVCLVSSRPAFSWLWNLGFMWGAVQLCK